MDVPCPPLPHSISFHCLQGDSAMRSFHGCSPPGFERAPGSFNNLSLLLPWVTNDMHRSGISSLDHVATAVLLPPGGSNVVPGVLRHAGGTPHPRGCEVLARGRASGVPRRGAVGAHRDTASPVGVRPGSAVSFCCDFRQLPAFVSLALSVAFGNVRSQTRFVRVSAGLVTMLSSQFGMLSPTAVDWVA